MSSLCRVAAGGFSIETAFSLEDTLSYISSNEPDKVLLPADVIFCQYEPIYLEKDDTAKCKNGVGVRVNNTRDGEYRVYGHAGEFLMFGRITEGKLKMIKGFY